jgi:hypothetical protein
VNLRIQTGVGVRTSLARAFDRSGAEALRAIERRRKSKIDFGFAAPGQGRKRKIFTSDRE